MSEPQPHEAPRMDDAFRARMRQGLSSMAVRERMRERRRSRAVAGGAVAAVVVATFAVVGAQALAGLQPERDQAAPPIPTHSTIQTPAEAPDPTEPTPEPTEPVETGSADLPPGLQGVAAGEPRILDIGICDGCGDSGAAGSGPVVERFLDVYVLCDGSGVVRYGGEPWIDCTDYAAGTGLTRLDLVDAIDDGDPQVTASDDFTGQLRVVDSGAPATGERPAPTATVYVQCSTDVGTATVGGVRFDCATAEADAPIRLVLMAAWGVPIEPGEFAPRVARDADGGHIQVTYVVER